MLILVFQVATPVNLIFRIFFIFIDFVSSGMLAPTKCFAHSGQ